MTRYFLSSLRHHKIWCRFNREYLKSELFSLRLFLCLVSSKDITKPYVSLISFHVWFAEKREEQIQRDPKGTDVVGGPFSYSFSIEYRSESCTRVEKRTASGSDFLIKIDLRSRIAPFPRKLVNTKLCAEDVARPQEINKFRGARVDVLRWNKSH